MARLKSVWRILSLHCDEASRLSSESLDHDLVGPDKLAWQVHRLLCGSCRRHLHEIVALREVAHHARQPLENPGVTLDDDVREQLKQSLKGNGPAA